MQGKGGVGSQVALLVSWHLQTYINILVVCIYKHERYICASIHVCVRMCEAPLCLTPEFQT